VSAFNDFNNKIIAEFRANEGRVGGPFAGAPMVLVHHVGARTGTERVAPLVYFPEPDGSMLIIASKGGAPTNPDWYHNLVSDPQVTVEVGDERFDARATVLEGDERDRLYAEQSRRYPGFAEYQASTERVIPVVALVRIRER
jgi:deazaflavin-dependent oxidoreductase (nitroreductase family)